MLCDDVKRVVYFFLDGSLGDRKQHEFKTHLSDCPDCETRTEVHRKLRDFVRKRLTVTGAPEHLKIRLSASLRISAE
ncbi:MAG TPA: zf-HC2 domain-containing protein [Thermoanaerobaculia bacterium]|jgi:mycothiol system anti-sigma-R factor